ncbi:MAG: membrane protein insertion efficiency factor YidD [Candidatus Omnitrophica bacterium]|nr:membrane protein insertion efficiency factor YidD [Candidatus Omnitrophota bacterium]
MLSRVSLNLIKIYQSCIRGFLPASCRFNPTCSEYTRQAIIKYGFFKGSIKGLKRILICHPFSGKSGYDPLE